MASRPRWERIPRDTNASTKPLWRAGSRPRRPGAAGSRSCGRTEKQGRSCTCRSGERRADRRSSSISHFGGKGPSERGESPEHRPCSGGWGETQCFSGGAPLARRQAAAHPGNRRQNTCAQKTRPRRMRRVWATRRASPAFAPSVPDTRKGRRCVRACSTGEWLGADGLSRASPLHPGKQDSIRWLDESCPLSKLPAAAAARAARWAGVTGGRLPLAAPVAYLRQESRPLQKGEDGRAGEGGWRRESKGRNINPEGQVTGCVGNTVLRPVVIAGPPELNDRRCKAPVGMETLSRRCAGAAGDNGLHHGFGLIENGRDSRANSRERL